MCHVNVNNKYSVAHCGICQSWVHMKRHKLNHIDCKYLQGLSDSWYCLSCRCKILMILTIDWTNNAFDIISVSETKITKQISLTTNISLKNYDTQFPLPESSAGSTPLYIASQLSYKPRPDLNIYKANQLESIFVEIINPKKNIVFGCL